MAKLPEFLTGKVSPALPVHHFDELPADAKPGYHYIEVSKDGKTAFDMILGPDGKHGIELGFTPEPPPAPTGPADNVPGEAGLPMFRVRLRTQAPVVEGGDVHFPVYEKQVVLPFFPEPSEDVCVVEGEDMEVQFSHVHYEATRGLINAWVYVKVDDPEDLVGVVGLLHKNGWQRVKTTEPRGVYTKP